MESNLKCVCCHKLKGSLQFLLHSSGQCSMSTDMAAAVRRRRCERFVLLSVKLVLCV